MGGLLGARQRRRGPRRAGISSPPRRADADEVTGTARARVALGGPARPGRPHAASEGCQGRRLGCLRVGRPGPGGADERLGRPHFAPRPGAAKNKNYRTGTAPGGCASPSRTRRCRVGRARVAGSRGRAGGGRRVGRGEGASGAKAAPRRWPRWSEVLCTPPRSGAGGQRLERGRPFYLSKGRFTTAAAT